MFYKSYKKYAMQKKRKRLSLSPMLITIILMAVQIIFFIILYTKLKMYKDFFRVGLLAVTVALVVKIITGTEKSAYKVAWILPITATPIFGVMLYALIKYFPGTRTLTQRMRTRIEKSKKHFNQDNHLIDEFDKVNEHYGDLAKLLYSCDNFPTYSGTNCEYYSLGEFAFEEIKKRLEKAEKYIFIEFFIIKQGKLLDEILEILSEKVKQGVEVRFLFDGSNFVSLPWEYDEYIRSLGIKCKVFLKPTPVLSSYQNNRDHRKIVVIDGKVAFTGGINLADEYANLIERFGHWKDCAIKIEGEAVRTFTGIFLQMWNIGEKDEGKSDFEQYLTKETQKEIAAVNSGYAKQNFVIPYADYPGNNDNPAESVYLHMLFFAKRYIYIMTPYLVIDDDFMLALKFASKRGVIVRLIIPGIPDKKIPYLVAKSYLPEIIDSGAEVYLYTPGFVHSKAFVSDDVVSTVGTVNLDFRSMYLHFENGVLAYDEDLAKCIKKDFEETFAKCEKISRSFYDEMPLFEKLAAKMFRIFAPIM